MADKIFTNGLIYKGPRQNAPSFVKGSLSVKVDDFIAWLQQHNTESGWVNIDIKESKGMKLYCELNTYKRGDNQASPEDQPDGGAEINAEDIPY